MEQQTLLGYFYLFAVGYFSILFIYRLLTGTIKDENKNNIPDSLEEGLKFINNNNKN